MDCGPEQKYLCNWRMKHINVRDINFWWIEGEVIWKLLGQPSAGRTEIVWREKMDCKSVLTALTRRPLQREEQ